MNSSSRPWRSAATWALPYDHGTPDKLRLPLDTPEIPYHFGSRPGW